MQKVLGHPCKKRFLELLNILLANEFSHVIVLNQSFQNCGRTKFGFHLLKTYNFETAVINITGYSLVNRIIANLLFTINYIIKILTRLYALYKAIEYSKYVLKNQKFDYF